MKSFLFQTASFYSKREEALKKTCFIFPNHRAVMHFRKELSEACDLHGRTLYSPKCYSINDFFQKVYGVKTTERIRLLMTLYACYSTLNDKAESLDDFIHWGNVMISDFDQIDKYMVDASKIFLNVSDFRSIQDTYQYLTETQRKAVEHFMAHFRDGSGHLTVNMDTDDEKVKARFLRVWNILGPLYTSFNETLEQDGMAYEGKIHRALAESIKNGLDIKTVLAKHFPDGVEKYVFVGLNALNECEKTLLRAVRDAGMAEFVWDFSSRELKDPRNKASFFLRKNIQEFPPAFPVDTDGPLKRPNVMVVSVPSSVGQTKLAPSILAQCQGEPEETVFVLPDERLLLPLVSAIPDEYDTVNITMGYPITDSGIYSLIKETGRLLLTLRVKDGKYYFYHKPVKEIFSSSIFRELVDDECRTVIEKVLKDAKQYVPLEDLTGPGMMDTFFRPLTVEQTQPDSGEPSGESLVQVNRADVAQNNALAERLLRILEVIKERFESDNADENTFSQHKEMELEFVERFQEAIMSLRDMAVPVQPATWLRLLDGLVRSENVPFEGDALKGLQVMGTLETRALDFRNVVILSANEDLFPHRSTADSFIPPELRKGFGMPTIEYQDSVWAYYFYRLIQRAENVWMLYDSRTEGLLSGEESRYIKQLEYHFRFPVKRLTAVAPLTSTAEEENIAKTIDDIRILKQERHLSASSLQSYLYCPAKFYYQAVKGLKTDDEVNETLDAALLGTVFHEVMEKLYSDKRTVIKADIQAMLQNEACIKEMVRNSILDKMKTIEIEGRNLVVEEVISEYVKAALRHDLKLLCESGSNGFRIIGLEKYLSTTIDGFKFIGFADRIDSYVDGQVRIVDYKTGHVEDDDIHINDSNASAVVDKLFGESNNGRPKIALQMFLYGLFAHEGIIRDGEQVVNSIYSTAKLMTNPLPDVPESEEFKRLVEEKLHGTLAEISDIGTPWKKTQDRHVCAMCDFCSICGR